MSLQIFPPDSRLLQGDIALPGSKSESNRALILQAISKGLVKVANLSAAEDTQVLQQLLRDNPDMMDVGHAGTAMRFLAAFLAFRPEDKVLTGSARMQQRPIGPLVDALRSMGAEILYLGDEGYPPLLVCGRNAKFGESAVRLPGDISSQFVSALLLVAHAQPDGLRIQLVGEVMSRPYIEMTLALLARFGVRHTWVGDTIHIARQHLSPGNYEVEADWSAASYWFCMAALAPDCALRLHGLRTDSLQGDRVVAAKMAGLGVRANWQGDVLLLTRGEMGGDHLQWDFADCPDLAQGLLVAAAALGKPVTCTGLQSLRIKETDRIAALQAELGKLGVQLVEGNGTWSLAGRLEPRAVEVATYDDHRMAMAFAPLALRIPGLRIADPQVVVKSYPGFWDDLRRVGFKLVGGE